MAGLRIAIGNFDCAEPVNAGVTFIVLMIVMMVPNILELEFPVAVAIPTPILAELPELLAVGGNLS